jgi:DNA-binding response OmpR family regulator
MARKRDHSEPGALQLAVLPVRTDKVRNSRESTENSVFQNFILLPMQWQDSPGPAESLPPPFPAVPVNDFAEFGDVRIDFSSQEAIRGDLRVTLTSMEFKTLKFFIENPYRVISRDELLNQVWGYDNYPCTRTVDNRILRLRQKLETDAANPRHFLTVYGAGYKFVP